MVTLVEVIYNFLGTCKNYVLITKKSLAFL